MNIQEIDKWLDNEYGVSYTRLEELHDFVAELLELCLNKDKEIERLNNIINEKNEEIKDYSNKWCELAKAKTKSDNIINELEKYYEEELKNLNYSEDKIYTQGIHDTIISHKYKLQELKGSDK